MLRNFILHSLTAVANSDSFISSMNFGFSWGSTGTSSLLPNSNKTAPCIMVNIINKFKLKLIAEIHTFLRPMFHSSSLREIPLHKIFCLSG